MIPLKINRLLYNIVIESDCIRYYIKDNESRIPSKIYQISLDNNINDYKIFMRFQCIYSYSHDYNSNFSRYRFINIYYYSNNFYNFMFGNCYGIYGYNIIRTLKY